MLFFEHVSDFRPSCIILKSFQHMELDSHVCVINIFFNVNSQGNEKLKHFSLEAYDFLNLENESLFTTDYKYLK